MATHVTKSSIASTRNLLSRMKFGSDMTFEDKSQEVLKLPSRGNLSSVVSPTNRLKPRPISSKPSRKIIAPATTLAALELKIDDPIPEQAEPPSAPKTFARPGIVEKPSV